MSSGDKPVDQQSKNRASAAVPSSVLVSMRCVQLDSTYPVLVREALKKENRVSVQLLHPGGKGAIVDFSRKGRRKPVSAGAPQKTRREDTKKCRQRIGLLISFGKETGRMRFILQSGPVGFPELLTYGLQR